MVLQPVAATPNDPAAVAAGQAGARSGSPLPKLSSLTSSEDEDSGQPRSLLLVAGSHSYRGIGRQPLPLISVIRRGCPHEEHSAGSLIHSPLDLSAYDARRQRNTPWIAPSMSYRADHLPGHAPLHGQADSLSSAYGAPPPSMDDEPLLNQSHAPR